jgi:hypothetical protein
MFSSYLEFRKMESAHKHIDSIDTKTFYLTEELHPISQNDHYISLWNHFRFVVCFIL